MGEIVNKRGKGMRLLAMVLSLLLVIGLVNQISSSADGGGPTVTEDADDITKYVDIELDDFAIERKKDTNTNVLYYIYKDGANVGEDDEAHKLKLNDAVVVTYKWGVREENISHVKNGVYFTFKLPDQQVLKAGVVNDYEIMDTKGKKIGKFSIDKDGIVKVTLIGDFSNTKVLKDGKIGAYAKVVSVKMDSIVFQPKSEVASAINIPVKTIHKENTTVGTEGDNGIFNNPIYHGALNEVGVFKKEAQQLIPSPDVQFTFRINYEAIRDIYKKRAVGDTAYEIKRNVYFVDEDMPDDLEISVENTSAQVYYWVPMLDPGTGNVTTTLSNQTIDSNAASVRDGKIMFGDKVFFTVEEGSGTKEEWITFRDNIIKRNKEDSSSRIIGIFNKKYIVVTVGDMPNDQIRYGDYYNNTRYYNSSEGINTGADYLREKVFPKFGQLSLGNKRLTADQIKYMQNAYAGKPIVDFVMRFRAIPQGVPKAKYQNKAKMHWDETQELSSTGNVVMGGAFGIVAMEPFAGTVKVRKEWKGTKKESATVRLFANDVEKDHVVLNEGNGWKHEFSGLPKSDSAGDITYSVKEDSIAGYKSVIEQAPGKYEFIVKNYEQRKILLTKKWSQKGSPLMNPDVDRVNFYLHDAKEASPTSSNALQVVNIEKVAGSDTWTREIEVNKTTDTGEEITYKVTEKEVDGFTQKGEVEGDMATGFTITNEKKEAPVEKIRIKLTKKWMDGDKALANPDVEEIKFYLHNEKELNPNAGNALYEEVFKKSDFSSNTTGVWEKTIEVNQKDALGEDIIYKVTENEVLGFKQKGKTEGNMTTGFVITNEKDPVGVITTGTLKPVSGTTTGTSTTETSAKETVEKEKTTESSVTPPTPTETTVFEPYSPIPVLPFIGEPDTPTVLASVPIIPEEPKVDEELEEMAIGGDGIPLGDTDADEDIEIEGDDIPQGDTETDFDSDNTSKGNKKILAKTGGLKTIFVSVLSVFGLLLLAFVLVEVMMKKSRE